MKEARLTKHVLSLHVYNALIPVTESDQWLHGDKAWGKCWGREVWKVKKRAEGIFWWWWICSLSWLCSWFHSGKFIKLHNYTSSKSFWKKTSTNGIYIWWNNGKFCLLSGWPGARASQSLTVHTSHLGIFLKRSFWFKRPGVVLPMLLSKADGWIDGWLPILWSGDPEFE